jgi:rubrerythrin
MKNFNTLSEREILALAISLEEEDERVYADFVEGLKQDFPTSASVFDTMRGEESGHRRRLIELYRQKFGEHIPLIRRQDVKGFVQLTPIWLMQPLGLEISGLSYRSRSRFRYQCRKQVPIFRAGIRCALL